MAGVVLDGYPHPAAASPTRVSFVPAYDVCATPNRVHLAPLAYPSCSPPHPSSNSLTVGTADSNSAGTNFVGAARWKVVVGTPGLPDDSDVVVELGLGDVRCRPGVSTCGSANSFDGPDYTGEVMLQWVFRLTDRFNAVSPGGGPDPATMFDVNFPITVQCVATSTTAAGSQCHATTTLNVVVPGSVKDGKRAIWEMYDVKVYDAGADGQTATAPNTLFASQGIFVP
jgi:hypothetical protein